MNQKGKVKMKIEVVLKKYDGEFAEDRFPSEIIRREYTEVVDGTDKCVSELFSTGNDR